MDSTKEARRPSVEGKGVFVPCRRREIFQRVWGKCTSFTFTKFFKRSGENYRDHLLFFLATFFVSKGKFVYEQQGNCMVWFVVMGFVRE